MFSYLAYKKDPGSLDCRSTSTVYRIGFELGYNKDMDSPQKFRSLDSFQKSPHHAIKHANHFEIYDRLLLKYRNGEVTFVEVGVLDGGSLFMWRDFFGNQARIIGIDQNPDATKWTAHGFEIHIGDQSSPEFWSDFYKKVGKIDVILDDGGHENYQQMTTLISSLPYIKQGGLIVIEDIATSFMRFGNFSKYSFFNLLNSEIESMHKPFPGTSNLRNGFLKGLFSVTWFTNVCAIELSSSLDRNYERVENVAINESATDFRYASQGSFSEYLRKLYEAVSIDYRSPKFARRSPSISKFIRLSGVRLFLRLFIVPIRRSIYFVMQLQNLKSVRRMFAAFQRST